MNTLAIQPWLLWALLSAAFAAATALFAKVGVHEVGTDMATFIRTVVVVVALATLLGATNQFHGVGQVSFRGWTFLTLSGLATGASWLCYFRALKVGDAVRVAPIDKLSVVLVAVMGVLFLGETLSFRQWLGVSFMGVGGILIALR